MSNKTNAGQVTVVGLGSMGTALARAFLGSGYRTTVWNRTASRATPLVTEGADAAIDIEAAVSASRLIVACLTSYEATLSALEPAVGALAGRTLVTLNTGTPAGARAMAKWAAHHGISFLDGAVKNTPHAIGQSDTLLYYSGDQAVFEKYKSALEVLGGDTRYLGADVDLAALYELAVGGTLLPALLGFFQGAALLTSRGQTAESMVPFTVKWLEMIAAELPRMAKEIDTGDYDNPTATLDLFYYGIEQDHAISQEGNLDISWQLPTHTLLRRAMDEGRGRQSIAALTELLRNGQPGLDDSAPRSA